MVLCSTLSVVLMSSSQHAQGCYVDGQITASSSEGTATTSPLPLAIPAAIQPAIIRVRSDHSYSISSILSYWYGSRASVDRVGISRTAQPRHDGDKYDAVFNVAVPAADGYSQNGLPSGSGSATRSYGPYLPVNEYSVEYIYLDMIDQWGTFWLPEITHTPILTNSNPGYAVAVYVYPKWASADFYDYADKFALNGKTFQGNGPKIEVKMSYLYPAGSSWVQLYKTGSPAQTIVVPGSQKTARATDMDKRDDVYDLSTLITAPGDWTAEVVQRTVYGDEHIGSATFTVINKINVNTELGSLR